MGESRDKELFTKTTTPSFFYITLPLALMGIATFVMGFMQEDIVEMITPKTVKEHHIEGLFISLMGSLTLLGIIVYYYYIKRLDLTQKIASQPLMQAIHKVLYNGYFVEYIIHAFVKNVVVGGVARAIYFIDNSIIDKSVISTKDIARKLRDVFQKTQRGYVSDNAGMMLFGVVFILVVIVVGGVK